MGLQCQPHIPTDDTQNIQVSVIIPLYNVRDFIAETLNELTKQTLQAVEYILIDDGSTDGTYEIAERFATNHQQFKIFRQENQGPSAARNHGLRVARGQYICFVDSDDLLPADALEVMYNAAIEHAADLVTGATVRFNSRSRWFIRIQLKKGVYTPGLKQITSHPELLYAMGPCAKLYKRELIQGVYFPEHIRLGEDQPFALHAYLHAKRIYTVDAIVYYYRARETNTESLTQNALKNPIQALDDLYEMLAITDQQLAHHDDIQHDYLERVMDCDIWPRCKAAIRSGEADLQRAAFASLDGWIRSLEDTRFNAVPYIGYSIVIGILYRVRQLRPAARPAAKRLLKTVLTKMDAHAYGYVFATASIRLLKKIARIGKRRLRRTRKTAESIIVRHVIFTFAKRITGTKKVVFATNKSEQLQGNLQAVYAALHARRSDWKAYVFTKKNRSFWEQCRQFYHLGSADIVLLDDYYHQLYGLKAKPGAQVIQIWHAAGAFKTFGISATLRGSRDANSLRFEQNAHAIYTKVVASSSTVAPLYAEAFGKRLDQVVALGVPRTDIFFDQQAIRQIKRHYLNTYPLLRNKRIVLYAPTFRGRPKERVQFELALDLEKMKQALAPDHVLLLKLHPAVRKAIEIPAHLQDFVMDLSTVSDINELLMISDMLITDYSSIVFEFSLLKRPMIFYAYDLDEYLEERGFYFPYQEFVPGPIATTTEAVIEQIVRYDFPASAIDEFAKRFFEYRDGKASERFIDMFFMNNPLTETATNNSDPPAEPGVQSGSA